MKLELRGRTRCLYIVRLCFSIIFHWSINAAFLASQLADELLYLATKFPTRLIVYTGSPSPTHDRRQSPDTAPPVRPVFESLSAPNTTLPEGGILKRYQLLTPGLITSLLLTLFVLVPAVTVGFKALASIQSPLRLEAPKGYSAADKKVQ